MLKHFLDLVKVLSFVFYITSIFFNIFKRGARKKEGKGSKTEEGEKREKKK